MSNGVLQLWQSLPPIWGVPLLAIQILIVVCIPLILTMAYLTYAERKVIGFMQNRLGPNRVGYRGLLQPFADVLKLMLKEIVIPANSNRFLFIIAPLLALIPAFATWAVVPFSPVFVLSDIEHPGTARMRIAGSLGAQGVETEASVVYARRIGKRRAADVIVPPL